MGEDCYFYRIYVRKCAKKGHIAEIYILNCRKNSLPGEIVKKEGCATVMKWIFSGLILLAVLFGILNGRMDAVTAAALRECGNAVELTLTLMGSMCLWSGLMKIAEKADLTEKISRLLSPVIRLLFRGMDYRSAAAKAITLNISANLLGLGNAATPLGIAAMKEMAKLAPADGAATNNMVLFVVLNTASLQLIPTTVAQLRQAAGSVNPLDIMPAVWVASLVSVVSGVVMARFLERIGGRGRRAGRAVGAGR